MSASLSAKKMALFHHEDGRVLDQEVFVAGPEPRWMGFDDEMVLVTGKRPDGSYEVKDHPRAAEIREALFADPFEKGFERANRIATAPLDKPVPPFLGYEVREGQSVRFFPAVEEVLDHLGLTSSQKATAILRYLVHDEVAHPQLRWRPDVEVILIGGPDLGRCLYPGCAGRLAPMLSRDGSAWEADGCNTCGRSWWHNPPKTAPKMEG